MQLFQYSIKKRETYNASGKAKKDVSDIMEKRGIQDIYYPSNYRPIRILQQFNSVLLLKRQGVIFIQYPAVIDLFIMLIKKIKPQVLLVGIVHDLHSLQENKDIKKEIDILNFFDVLVVHNPSMENYLRKYGYKGHMVILSLFDYLHEINKPITDVRLNNTICFAGNLDKSIFINQLSSISNVQFYLYGSCSNVNMIENHNSAYKGCFSSDEITYCLEGAFGLIWDGDAIDTCSGNKGMYLLYNNPHKLSLYIAAAKPVITWKKAAIAPFIQKENIGILVSDLKEIPEAISKLSSTDYMEMVSNTKQLKYKIANGYFLDKAIDCVMEFINNKG